MGQISTAFNHISSLEKVTELSVVLYADSFFYGLWGNSQELLKSDVHSISNFGQLLKVWNNNYNLEMIRLMSTQIPYAHLLHKDFEEAHFEDYFKGLYNVKRRKNFRKEIDFFSNPSVNTLHFIQDEIISALGASDCPFRIGHISTALVNYSALNEENILIFISEKVLHIGCFENGKLQFYNQFYCKSSTDYIYFILLVLKLYNLDPNEQEICIGGHIVEGSPLFIDIASYVKNVKLVDLRLSMGEQESQTAQLYFDLYLSRICV